MYVKYETCFLSDIILGKIAVSESHYSNTARRVYGWAGSLASLSFHSLFAHEWAHFWAPSLRTRVQRGTQVNISGMDLVKKGAGTPGHQEDTPMSGQRSICLWGHSAHLFLLAYFFPFVFASPLTLPPCQAHWPIYVWIWIMVSKEDELQGFLVGLFSVHEWPHHKWGIRNKVWFWGEAHAFNNFLSV